MIDKAPIQVKLQFTDIAHWNHNDKDRLDLVNVDTPTDPKLLKLNENLSLGLRQTVESLFREFIDVFTFSYEDLHGIPEHKAIHRIDLNLLISSSHEVRYRINPNYAKAVKDDLERLLSAEFIAPLDQASWLSPTIVVPKKNEKLRICVDFRRLDAATKKDPYPLLFTDEVLDAVLEYDAYSFIDCFSRYHHVRIHLDDRPKTTFIIEWGAYVWVVMPFGLKNAPPTYERIANKVFKDYLADFMKLFMDDFSVYSDMASHLPKLRLVFTKCRQYGINLNPEKYIFYVVTGVILGYIVGKEGKFPDPKKIQALVDMPTPKDIEGVQTFNGLA